MSEASGEQEEVEAKVQWNVLLEIKPERGKKSRQKSYKTN
jgi:hypothetical protein